MKNRNKFILAILLVPVVFFLLNYIGLFNFEGLKHNKRCDRKDLALSQHINGIIIKKYEDTKNHNLETIEIRGRDGEVKTTTILTNDLSRVYDQISVGDLIIKREKDLTVLLQKENGSNLKFQLDYDCKE